MAITNTKKSIRKNEIKKIVKYSLKKYRKAYELLEEYDKQTHRKATDMADPGRLRGVIPGF